MGEEVEVEPVIITPEGEELVLLEPGTIVYGTVPCTFGMEIEQLDEDILKCTRIREQYEWHYDGSGPYETGLPPSIAPRTELKRFIDLVLADGCQWQWKNSFEKWHLKKLIIPYVREHGCGSHIHLRPRPALRHKLDPKYKDVPGLVLGDHELNKTETIEVCEIDKQIQRYIKGIIKRLKAETILEEQCLDK